MHAHAKVQMITRALKHADVCTCAVASLDMHTHMSTPSMLHNGVTMRTRARECARTWYYTLAYAGTLARALAHPRAHTNLHMSMGARAQATLHAHPYVRT